MRTRKTSSRLLNMADDALIKVASYLGSADFMALTATCRYARSLANEAAAYEGCVWPLVRRGRFTPAMEFMDHAMDTVYRVNHTRHLVVPALAFHSMVAGREIMLGPSTGPLGPVATCVSGLAGLVLDAIDVARRTEPVHEELVRQAVFMADTFAHALLHLQDAIVAGVYDAHMELKDADGSAQFVAWLLPWAQQYASLMDAATAMITGDLPMIEGGKVGLDAEVVLGTINWAATLLCMDNEDEAEGAAKWGHLVDAYASSLFTGYMLDRRRRMGTRGRALPRASDDASRRQAAFHAAMATAGSDTGGGGGSSVPAASKDVGVHMVADVTAIVAATAVDAAVEAAALAATAVRSEASAGAGAVSAGAAATPAASARAPAAGWGGRNSSPASTGGEERSDHNTPPRLAAPPAASPSGEGPRARPRQQQRG